MEVEHFYPDRMQNRWIGRFLNIYRLGEERLAECQNCRGIYYFDFNI